MFYDFREHEFKIEKNSTLSSFYLHSSFLDEKSVDLFAFQLILLKIQLFQFKSLLTFSLK